MLDHGAVLRTLVAILIQHSYLIKYGPPRPPPRVSCFLGAPIMRQLDSAEQNSLESISAAGVIYTCSISSSTRISSSLLF